MTLSFVSIGNTCRAVVATISICVITFSPAFSWAAAPSPEQLHEVPGTMVINEVEYGSANYGIANRACIDMSGQFISAGTAENGKIRYACTNNPSALTAFLSNQSSGPAGRADLANNANTNSSTNNSSTPDSLAGLFQAAFNTALIVGAMLAVARLIYAGAIYMTTDLPGAKGNAKGIIGEAMTGLLLLLAVWLILAQINPQILNLNILTSITPIDQAPTPANTSQPVTGGTYDQNTCTSSGGTVNPNTGACVFSNGSGGTPPDGSWCSGNNCYSTEAACNANRGRISNPCVPDD